VEKQNKTLIRQIITMEGRKRPEYQEMVLSARGLKKCLTFKHNYYIVSIVKNYCSFIMQRVESGCLHPTSLTFSPSFLEARMEARLNKMRNTTCSPGSPFRSPPKKLHHLYEYERLSHERGENFPKSSFDKSGMVTRRNEKIDYSHISDGFYEACIYGGRICRKIGDKYKPIDSKKEFTNKYGKTPEEDDRDSGITSGPRRGKSEKSCIVFSQDGKLYVSPYKANRSQHTSTIGFRGVSETGMAKIIDGKVASLSNQGGHFRTKPEELIRCIECCKDFVKTLGPDTDMAFEDVVGDVPFRLHPFQQEAIRSYITTSQRRSSYYV
jgi:hypothetical protein